MGLKTEKEVEDLVMKAAKEGNFIRSEPHKGGEVSDIYRMHFDEKYDIKVVVSQKSGEIITAHPYVR